MESATEIGYPNNGKITIFEINPINQPIVTDINISNNDSFLFALYNYKLFLRYVNF